MQREKKIISGKLLEVSFYPVYPCGRAVPRRPKEKVSTTAQAKYNRTKAVKKAIRDINANFDTDDLFVTPTYFPENAPQTEEQAERDIRNFIRRIKTKRQAELKRLTGLCKAYPENKDYKKQLKVLQKPFRFYYRTERTCYKSGNKAGKSNWHFHLFITGGIDRDTIEDMWPYRINADRFRPDKFGAEAAARYAAKPAEKDNERVKLHHSRNLAEPKTPPPKDGQISKRGVEKLATQRIEDRAYWEKRYPGYKFLRCFARYNEYNGNWYVTTLMYRYDHDPPEWTISEWLEE